MGNSAHLPKFSWYRFLHVVLLHFWSISLPTFPFKSTLPPQKHHDKQQLVESLVSITSLFISVQYLDFISSSWQKHSFAASFSKVFYSHNQPVSSIQSSWNPEFLAYRDCGVWSASSWRLHSSTASYTESRQGGSLSTHYCPVQLVI